MVALLRAMLQPSPDRRPTAQQVIQVVEREQPEVAAAAAEAVIAAVAAAAVAHAAGTAAVSPLPPKQPAAAVLGNGATALVPSPFQQPTDQSPRLGAGGARTPAAAPAPAEAAAAAVQFSFDVPVQQPCGGGFAFTPGQPLRPHNHRRTSNGSTGAPPGTAAKGTPGGRARLGGPGRWAPALSPLISEGALTPGALASLAGLTPGTHRGGGSEGAPTPTLGGFAGGSGGSGQRAAVATPLDARRPAPLQLPPHSVAQAARSNSGPLSGGSLPLSSGGMQGSGEGWRLHRRDIISPDSDILAGGRGGCMGPVGWHGLDGLATDVG